MNVPRCRECENYQYLSQSENGFRFCKHDDVFILDGIAAYVKEILFSESKTSPQWCPLRKERSV